MKNSSDFVKRIQETIFDEHNRMISFDIVSLFTRVPVEAIDIISSQDNTLDERTLPHKTICQLTKVCILFQFKEGTVIGSPLSPVIANLCIEAFEERALLPCNLQPKMRVRYMDDKLVIWPHRNGALVEFHHHLNRQNSVIPFTME